MRREGGRRGEKEGRREEGRAREEKGGKEKKSHSLPIPVRTMSLSRKGR